MRLSKAQTRIISNNIHAQDAWTCRGGWKMGCVPEDGYQRRTINALIKKGAMEACGHITMAGRDAWRKAVRRSEKA